MKLFNKEFYLSVLSVLLLSTFTFGQLPSDLFVAYATGNPVIPRSSSGWDAYTVFWPGVTFVEDTFYITYNGTNDFNNTPIAIGLATSIDGYNFSKSNPYPIFSSDSNGFDAYSVEHGLLYYDNSEWYLYYSGRSAGPNYPGNAIGRAVSNVGPQGPWIRSEDVLLTVGSPGEWDSEIIGPDAIIKFGSELIMYYWASNFWPGGTAQIGRATSTDGGLTWEKYDDPTTPSPPFAESDPVLQPDKPYDENGIFGCSVFNLDTSWEMYYSGSSNGTDKICYATSIDGIVWNKPDSLNPIFTQDPISIGILEKPAIVKTDTLFFMYYDYGIDIASLGIGLATVTVPSVNLNPTQLIFGDVEVGSSETLTFTITNTGNSNLDVTNITSNDPAFTVNITNDTITPGTNQDVEVTFTPINMTSYNGVIEISHNAVGSPDSVTVGGSGVITGIEDELLKNIPNDFVVYQNYPNPFNPSTSIIFGLPEASEFKLTLFNSLGEEVAKLFEGYKNAGYHKVEFSAAELPSGVYFYQLKAGTFVETKKMILMK